MFLGGEGFMVGSRWKSLIALSLGAALFGLPTASFAVVPISAEFAVIASGGTITVTNNSGTAAQSRRKVRKDKPNRFISLV